jgi:predicted DNA-binding transcriptional regulator YafY
MGREVTHDEQPHHGEGIMTDAQSKQNNMARAVTADRVARLYRLLEILAQRPSARPALLRKLGMNQRGFYRDIEFLRSLGIGVTTAESRYSLDLDFDAALARLPFPDPHLKLGQAIVLARGKTTAHKALQRYVKAITESPSPKRKSR